MKIRLIQKSCPNCGANLKFNVNDESVTVTGALIRIGKSGEVVDNPIMEVVLSG